MKRGGVGVINNNFSTFHKKLYKYIYKQYMYVYIRGKK
jgi:hypothetical protein